jgi:glycosyltransferase involved in cell wall biosynthesis
MVDLATETAGIELVIATKFPSYLVRHPNKVAWIFHKQREVYDLHATPFGMLTSSDQDRGLRQALVELDLRALGENRALFANSGNTAARVNRYCGFEARPLYAPPKLYRDLHPGPYGDYLFYVGRLDRIKRIDLTLRALALTRGSYKLKIAGRGPHLDELRRTVTELGLAQRVEFLGFVSDQEVVELYAGCFAVALTPHDEDYGFTTLEAFFAGKPVVTTEDSGGVLEWVQDGTTGFVTAPEPEPLAEKIDQLAEDRALCERLGTAGRERVLAEVSWPLAVEALTATLE